MTPIEWSDGAPIYRQLKEAYGLSRASALWRTAALIVLSLIAIILFALRDALGGAQG